MTIERPPELPVFRYHPDPLGTGSVIASGQSCDVCGQTRGYVYDGPVHSEDDQWALCPWCIAEGRAADQLGIQFTAAPEWGDDVPEQVTTEVLHRTPGYSAWQPERWLSHHGDAAAFLGPCGIAELRKHGDGAVEAARRYAVEHLGEAHPDQYLESLSLSGSPTAYLFRCLECQDFLAYSDSDDA
jgi:uncharacterized protein